MFNVMQMSKVVFDTLKSNFRVYRYHGKVNLPLCFKLSTIPRRRFGEWKYSSMYEGVSKSFRLAARGENCKWYSSLQLSAVLLLFCESV
jgi:hypothetical protein